MELKAAAPRRAPPRPARFIRLFRDASERMSQYRLDNTTSQGVPPIPRTPLCPSGPPLPTLRVDSCSAKSSCSLCQRLLSESGTQGRMGGRRKCQKGRRREDERCAKVRDAWGI